MNQIRKIIREELNNMSKDIVITIPKNIDWNDYKKELNAVEDGSSVMNFKVNQFPKTSVGSRCYLVHDGYIKGWMQIVGFSEEEFTCTVTGKNWSGKFVQRSDPFHKITQIPMRGFQGFRYFN